MVSSLFSLRFCRFANTHTHSSHSLSLTHSLSFLLSLSYHSQLGGKQATFPVTDFPAVTTTAAWDGQDAPVEEFEEIDLSSLDDVSLDESTKTEL